MEIESEEKLIGETKIDASVSDLGNMKAIINRKPRKRLIISKIKLINFKSYYGEHIIGPLHWNFTAVIGANGSGKSNLLEALVFVFGARASKMRLKTLKEVIHNSTDHRNCTRADVTIYFDELVEDLTTDPISWKESNVNKNKFSVGRVVRHANNDSGQEAWYEINGEKETAEDVKIKLMDKELDLVNNRFMILQGEVEQISLMKPMTGESSNPGLLEYLEEIIGTNIYVEDILDFTETLEEKVSERQKVQESCKATRMALDDIGAEKNEAVKYAKAERSLALKNCLFNTLKNYKIGETIKEKKLADKELKKDKEKLENEIKKKADENKQRFEERNKISKKITKLEDECKVYKDHKIPNCKTTDVQLKDEEKNAYRKEIELNDDIKEIEDQIEVVIQKGKEAEENLPAIEMTLDELKKRKEEFEKKLEAELTRLAPKTNEKRLEKLNLEEQLDKPLKDLQEITNEIESIKGKLEILSQSDLVEKMN